MGALNLALSLGILVLLGTLARALLARGKDVILPRIFLKWKPASRATGTLLLGIIALAASNAVGFVGHTTDDPAFHVAEELGETLALVLILAGHVWFALILRIPGTSGPVRVEPPKEERR